MQDTSMQTHALCQMLIRPNKRDMNISIENYMLSLFYFLPYGDDDGDDETRFLSIFASMSGLEQIFL